MTTPYYADGTVTLWHGDMRTILPELAGTYDCCVTDPPYGETSLAWDRWPDGWPALVAEVTSSMWCFGSMRMFLDRRDEFTGWRLSHDTVGEFEIDTVVWEKQQGSGPSLTDRFSRVHELATHWYRGAWGDLFHEVPRIASTGPDRTWKRDGPAVADRTPHRGSIGPKSGYVDDGTRIMRSVLRVRNLRQIGAIHESQKPLGILDPLIRYACPPGGIVLDPFAGSGSTADTARASGRHAVLIEAHEPYCEVIARRLAQGDLFGGAA